MKTIGIVVGSLREKSFNKSIAQYIAANLPGGYEAKFIDWSKLSIYNQDFDENPPQDWVEFRDSIRGLDALLFVTPEYNRSIPGGLKNAIDVGSRPYGHSVWGGKPGGVISVSPGAIGGFGANNHLRQVLAFLNVYPLQQPEAYLGNVMASLDADGKVVNEDTQKYLQNYIEKFTAWVDRF